MSNDRKRSPSSLSILSSISVSSPCRRADWEQMSPGIGGRRCGQCKKQVWDSTSLSRNQFRVVLGFGQKMTCIRLVRDSQGELQFKRSASETRVLGMLRSIPLLAASAGALLYLSSGAVCSIELAEAEEGTALESGSAAQLRPLSSPELGATPSANPWAARGKDGRHSVVYGGPDPEPSALSRALLLLEGVAGAAVMCLAALVALVCGILALIRRSRRLGVIALVAALVSLVAFCLRALTFLFFSSLFG